MCACTYYTKLNRAIVSYTCMKTLSININEQISIWNSQLQISEGLLYCICAINDKDCVLHCILVSMAASP